MKIKICGIRSLKDAESALEAGADFLGFNFYPKSPRCLEPARAAEIVKDLPSEVAVDLSLVPVRCRARRDSLPQSNDPRNKPLHG